MPSAAEAAAAAPVPRGCELNRPRAKPLCRQGDEVNLYPEHLLPDLDEGSGGGDAPGLLGRLDD